jgi:hypothetical protein
VADDGFSVVELKPVVGVQHRHEKDSNKKPLKNPANHNSATVFGPQSAVQK